mmetsp:Transcript_26986/g.86767  ORF Transcript_26986/g.86767 Transcript_26986/m.86767 type:complete len:246 (+) Transcript_26986:88-825(+)
MDDTGSHAPRLLVRAPYTAALRVWRRQFLLADELVQLDHHGAVAHGGAVEGGDSSAGVGGGADLDGGAAEGAAGAGGEHLHADGVVGGEGGAELLLGGGPGDVAHEQVGAVVGGHVGLRALALARAAGATLGGTAGLARRRLVATVQTHGDGAPLMDGTVGAVGGGLGLSSVAEGDQRPALAAPSGHALHLGLDDGAVAGEEVTEALISGLPLEVLHEDRGGHGSNSVQLRREKKVCGQPPLRYH